MSIVLVGDCVFATRRFDTISQEVLKWCKFHINFLALLFMRTTYLHNDLWIYSIQTAMFSELKRFMQVIDWTVDLMTCIMSYRISVGLSLHNRWRMHFDNSFISLLTDTWSLAAVGVRECGLSRYLLCVLLRRLNDLPKADCFQHIKLPRCKPVAPLAGSAFTVTHLVNNVPCRQRHSKRVFVSGWR